MREWFSLNQELGQIEGQIRATKNPDKRQALGQTRDLVIRRLIAIRETELMTSECLEVILEREPIYRAFADQFNKETSDDLGEGNPHSACERPAADTRGGISGWYRKHSPFAAQRGRQSPQNNSRT